MRGRQMAVFFLLWLFLAVPALAGPFSSFPGSRARSMAGAFSAVADDLAAIWYNPAGLADRKNHLVVEWGQAVAVNGKEGSPEPSQTSWFAGGCLSTNDTNNSGAGLFFDKPASFDIGLAYKHEFSDRESLLVALQYGHTQWGRALGKNSGFSHNQWTF